MQVDCIEKHRVKATEDICTIVNNKNFKNINETIFLLHQSFAWDNPLPQQNLGAGLPDSRLTALRSPEE